MVTRRSRVGLATLACVVSRRCVGAFLNHLVTLLADGVQTLVLQRKNTRIEFENIVSFYPLQLKEKTTTKTKQGINNYHLLPVHALIEVLKLQPALSLGAGRPDAVGTLDQLLLKGVAARSPLVRLRPALQQQPAVHVHAQARLQVHERHRAEERNSPL